MYITTTNSVAIGQTAAEIWQFFGFQNGGRPSWILKVVIFNGQCG